MIIDLYTTRTDTMNVLVMKPKHPSRLTFSGDLEVSPAGPSGDSLVHGSYQSKPHTEAYVIGGVLTGPDSCLQHNHHTTFLKIYRTSRLSRTTTTLTMTI